MVNRRNFRTNPVTMEELQETHWYAVDNDLIGGYSVATVDKPESQQNVYEGDFTVGTFMTRAMAEHIVQIHNEWWDLVVWNSYYENILAAMVYDIASFYPTGQAPLPDGVAPLTEDDWFDYDDQHETP